MVVMVETMTFGEMFLLNVENDGVSDESANLGYMLAFGYGIRSDRTAAIDVKL